MGTVETLLHITQPHKASKKLVTMTMWADKYQKIDSAVAEFTENADLLEKDASCNKSKEHFLGAVRTLELMQTNEIDMLLETIISELHGKEKELLENEAKQKIESRRATLEKAKELRAKLKL